MRLTDKEIKDYREAVTHGTCWTDNTKCNECTSLPMCNLVKKLLDEIKSQQQEISRQIYEHGIVAENRDLQEKRGDELLEEKRELQAQNAAMWDVVVLTKFFTDHWSKEEKEEPPAKKYIELVDNALFENTVEYHNPADVEALEQLRRDNKSLASAAIEKPPYKVELLEAVELAKQALENIGMFNVDDPLKSDRLCREALAAIEAVEK